MCSPGTNAIRFMPALTTDAHQQCIVKHVGAHETEHRQQVQKHRQLPGTLPGKAQGRGHDDAERGQREQKHLAPAQVVSQRSEYRRQQDD